MEIVTRNRSEFDINTLMGVQRNILVQCPVHGQKYIGVMGHHIDPPFPHAGAKVGGRRQNKAGRNRKPSTH